MSVSSMNRVMQHIRQVAVDADDPCECDADLLGRFLAQSDSRAVSLLIRRHAPMVWGVCRRILFDHHDAEDAFQATFVVLLRKANTIKPRSMVGNWLHGVALQTALKARAMTMKRSIREKPMATVPDPAPKATADHPLLAFLDEELHRLPDKYRVALVLCDLEGKTRAEAARELGWAEGTVASSLARGRQMLAKRLGRHGVIVSSATISALLANNIASAAPAAVVATTVQAAVTIVAAKTVAAAGLSQQVMTLADGVVKTMLLSKLKAALTVVLVLGFVVTGAAVLTSRMAAAPGDQPPVAIEQPALERKPEPKEDKEAFTAWGTEVGGLQAGLGFRPGEKRVYSHGETVSLVVRVRNVSDKEINFNYILAYFVDWPPSVTDGTGKAGPPIRFPGRGGDYNTVQKNLAPGKEFELAELKLELRPASESGNKKVNTLYGSGKFQIHYERLMYQSGAVAIASILRKLATGKLELEIKAEAPKQQGTRQQRPEENAGKGKASEAAQDTDPEKFYRTMEKKIRAAKSLHVALNSEVDSQAVKGTAKATIYAAEGNKSRMEVDFDIDGKADKLLFLTDGKAQYTKQGDRGNLDANPKKAAEQSKLVPVMMARIGLMGAMLMARSVKPGEDKEVDLDKDAPVTNFKLGAKEMIGDRPAQVVTYDLDFDGKSAKISVWIDTKMQLPLKRVVAAEDDGQKFRVTETYSTFAIDPKLEPKLFEIPKE